MGKKKSNKKSGIKRVGVIVLIVILFVVLYFLSALGGLRFFLLHKPYLTAFPFGERTYLVLLQNNNELRPGGGFISSYGIMKFKNGMPHSIEINDVYKGIDDHEYVEPPYPHEELLGGEFYAGFTFRDANHYGDFELTREEIIKMYRLTNPDAEFDGVIAVNFKVIEDILEVLETVEVGDLTFTNQNLFELLEYSVHNIDYHDVEQIYTRKSLLKPFANALMKKAALSPLKWRLITNTIINNLEEKHIQLYFDNESLQSKIADRGWDGEWPDTENDFLAVVESNLGGMKSDRYISRDVTYKINIEEDPVDGGYTHISDFNLDIYHYGDYNIPISGLYKGYFRVYFPKGTELLSSNYNITEINETEKYTTFGYITQLEPGEKDTLNLKLRLPKTIFNGLYYNLDVVKQSGTIADNYNIVVEIPQGLGIDTDTFEDRENFAIFNGPLIHDQHLSFKVIPDEIGPRVAYSLFNSLNEIEIHFNENIEAQSALDPLNYSIKDTDKTNDQISDNLRIVNISHEGKIVKLEIAGMTEQDEEFYELTMKNIIDIHGNSIKESPKTISLVQRLELEHDEDETEVESDNNQD